MSLEPEESLKRLLKLRDGAERILKTRENTQIEFKQSFNLGSMPEYARTMVAFANAEGGFIVYGVRNSPRELIGVNHERFESIDPAKVTSFLNAHCSPELQWDMGTIEFGGVRLGYLYTHSHFRKPVIVTTTSGKELKEGEIYYRYRGQTTTIRFAELRTLIDALLDQERRGWLQHLSTISKAGAMNVAVLDTLQGKLFGAGAPFLIDEALLRQIKFIREGHFTESTGAPALRLVGEVRTVSGVTTAKVVQRGIHYDDLLTAFLAKAREEKAMIFGGDESGLRSDHAVGRTYGRKGQTPVIPITGTRFKCNMISAISNKGQLHFMVFRDRFNADLFNNFLSRMLRQNRGKIFLIVDRHPVHRSSGVKDWLKVHEDRIRMFFLPGYSPELNPDELLNQDVKSNALGRKRPRNAQELVSNTRSFLWSRQRRPETVKKYFHGEHVRYAA